MKRFTIRCSVLIGLGVLFGCGEQPVRQDRKVAETHEVPKGADPVRWKAGRAAFEAHVDLDTAAAIFVTNCVVCHKVGVDGGFDVRRALHHLPEQSAERLFLHLLHEDSMVQANDPWTMEVRRQWNTNDWHHGMIGLTDAEAVQLVGWIAAGAPM